jgi:lantibiotic modifying enzyme
MEYGLGENNCVCHGNLGLLNFLFEAARHRNDVGLQDYARRCCRTILDIKAQEGWICDAPGGAEVHGFMSGLSGVGYSLLRFASPDQHPCFLLLE